MFRTSVSRLSGKFSLGLFQYILCQKKMADIRVSAASLVFTYEASGLDLRVNFSKFTPTQKNSSLTQFPSIRIVSGCLYLLIFCYGPDSQLESNVCRLPFAVTRVTLKVFQYSFSETIYRYFSMKVILSLSNHYEIFTTD